VVTIDIIAVKYYKTLF